MLRRRERFVRYSTLLLLFGVAGCAMTPEQHAAQAERDYGEICAKRGLARDSDKWRACIESEDLNASLAKQRAYEQEFLRQRDCTDPLAGCGGTKRYP